MKALRSIIAIVAALSILLSMSIAFADTGTYDFTLVMNGGTQQTSLVRKTTSSSTAAEIKLLKGTIDECGGDMFGCRVRTSPGEAASAYHCFEHYETKSFPNYSGKGVQYNYYRFVGQVDSDSSANDMRVSGEWTP